MSEQEDLDIISELIDANCRAYNEEFGYHYDSRCLEHYNRGIARLIQGGRVQHHAPPAGKNKIKTGTPSAQYDAEVVEIAEHPRLRSTYISAPAQVARPTSDPMWAKWQKENLALKEELAKLKGQA